MASSPERASRVARGSARFPQGGGGVQVKHAPHSWYGVLVPHAIWLLQQSRPYWPTTVVWLSSLK
ncbi:hypothetical protein BE17_41315 [Sorangium cellulosum]|uniref:Uncharacterized protein n=1 Tax=Sorangium cellulosum TaxID=56 RepID=A0A150RWK7_SORCE|nr:hypothetical protein BE17_41315 [Sorangium cellulosum]